MQIKKPGIQTIMPRENAGKFPCLLRFQIKVNVFVKNIILELETNFLLPKPFKIRSGLYILFSFISGEIVLKLAILGGLGSG